MNVLRYFPLTFPFIVVYLSAHFDKTPIYSLIPGGHPMKSFLWYVAAFFAVILLTTTSFTSFSQVRGFQAINDTIDLYPGIPVVYNILANDNLPAGDTTIRYVGIAVAPGGNILIQKTHDSAWNWVFTFTKSSWGYGGEIPGIYSLRTLPFDTSSAHILFRIHDKSYSYLDINNVSARFSASGSHFFYDTAQYEVPKGSGKTSIFCNTLWIGGKDGQGQLHFAGERYRQGAGSGAAGRYPDFYAGPVMDSSAYSIYQDTVWNYIWNLKKSDIDYHKAHYSEPGYKPVHDILTWPGNGYSALGQAHKLAPFFDVNADGTYDPFVGDFPVIRGDQALFFIFNDDRGYHYESTGTKLRIEIHGMAYAFDMPEDTALKNTVFLNYRIFNRSQNTYDTTLLGVFTDIDLGYSNDDYMGCDVQRSMYYGYNGTPVDGFGQSYAYGVNPPVQGVTILGGPLMDPDGLDNPRYSNTGQQLCDFSVNGVNFGDSIVDNERFGLTKFLYFNNSNSGVPGYMTDPYYAPEYYLFLNGIWKDGSPMIYGGNAHFSAGGYGPVCHFMFPGLSDSLNWGVGCVPPNGPVLWTESTAQNNPQDRRGMGVTGPFTFKPGDVQELDIAFTWARDYDTLSASGSLAKLQQLTDTVNKVFATNRLPNGNSFNGISDHLRSSGLTFKIYPNPAADDMNIEFGRETLAANTTIDLMTSQGNCVKRIVVNDHRKSVHFDVSEIPSGLYFIRVTTTESMVVKKVVVMH
jgi:hypothetical protein